MSSCLVCCGELIPFLDLGMQPSANRFLTKKNLNDEEYKYSLRVGLCSNCTMIQTLERPRKEEMFNDDYAYFTSSNAPMVNHFQEYAERVKSNFLNKSSVVVEVGSNDGVFLRHFSDYKHLGFEPSANVAEIAREKGVNCVCEFFNIENALRELESFGKADFVFIANVIGHVEELTIILQGVKACLSDKGQFVFEIYYLPEMLKRGTFDLIYDEHIFYYTLLNFNITLNRYGLELFDVEFIPVHGGSIRGYVSHLDAYEKSETLLKRIEEERSKGLDTIAPLNKFAVKVAKIKDDLSSLVVGLKQQGHKIAGYGATAKSTTLLNYCDLTNNEIDYVVDSTPFKQGKYTPGSHIPILPEDEFTNNPPDYTILFAWNYQDAIMKKQEGYSGKWIFIHPEVKAI